MPEAAENSAEAGQQAQPNNNNRNRNFRNRRARNPAATSKFRSSVPGLEDDVFDIGASANPASFNQVMEKIGLYIQKNYKEPNDIVLAIRNRARPNLTLPPRPVKGTQSDAEFSLDIFDYQEERKVIAARERVYKAHESNAWALIFDQCSTGLKTQLEGAPGYAAARASNDIVTLISLIQGYCCHFDRQSQTYIAIAETFKSVCLLFQRAHQSNDEYFKDFTSLVETLETYGGNGALGYLPTMIASELQLLCDQTSPPTPITSATDAMKTTAAETVRSKFLAALMLSGADRNRFGGLRDELANDFAKGEDCYPSSMPDVLNLMNKYRGQPSAQRRFI